MTTFFCHDVHTLFYPHAPGRIYAIRFHALGDCDGSPEDFADSTEVVDLEGMLFSASKGVGERRDLLPYVAPSPDDARPDPIMLIVAGRMGLDDVADIDDAIGKWADWCDADGERLDALDGETVASDADAATVSDVVVAAGALMM